MTRIEQFEATLREEEQPLHGEPHDASGLHVAYIEQQQQQQGQDEGSLEENIAHKAVENAIDLKAWDVRLAAVLNTLDIAREHGARKEWTSGDSRAIRHMMTTLDASVTGEAAGVVPSGFSSAVRTKYVAEIAAAGKAAAKT